MQISANTAQLAQAVADVNQKLDSMGEAGKKASSDLSTLKNIEIGRLALDGIQAATGAFTSLAGAVTSAATKIAGFALNVGKQLDALNDVANRTGVGVEALQAYSRAAELNGGNIEGFARSIQKLTINIGQATLDEKAQASFKELGITFAELKSLTPERQFEQIVDAISQIADPTERAARAVQFFGKGGIELGELFTRGPGYLESIRKDTEALGGIIREDAVNSIGDMFDAFGKVQGVVANLAAQVLGELAGPISQIAQDLLGVIRQAGPQQIAQQVAQGLLDFIKLAGNSFFKLAEFIEAFIKKFAPILGLDIRSEAEKELEALRNKEAGTTRTVSIGGRPVVQFTPGELTTQEKQRLGDLERQVAAEASGSVLRQFQANFNAAIDTASQSLQQRMEANAAEAGPNAAEEKQVTLLEQINRNGQVGTVEILN